MSAKSIREELEQVIIIIQLRRATAADAVKDLLAKRSAGAEPGDEPAQEPTQEPVVRFQNANAKSFMFQVSKPFKVADLPFEEKASVVVRRTTDGKFELENRETAARVIMDLDVWEKVREGHLSGQWPEGEWGF